MSSSESRFLEARCLKISTFSFDKKAGVMVFIVSLRSTPKMGASRQTDPEHRFPVGNRNCDFRLVLMDALPISLPAMHYGRCIKNSLILFLDIFESLADFGQSFDASYRLRGKKNRPAAELNFMDLVALARHLQRKHIDRVAEGPTRTASHTPALVHGDRDSIGELQANAIELGNDTLKSAQDPWENVGRGKANSRFIAIRFSFI